MTCSTNRPTEVLNEKKNFMLGGLIVLNVAFLYILFLSLRSMCFAPVIFGIWFFSDAWVLIEIGGINREMMFGAQKI